MHPSIIIIAISVIIIAVISVIKTSIHPYKSDIALNRRSPKTKIKVINYLFFESSDLLDLQPKDKKNI